MSRELGHGLIPFQEAREEILESIENLPLERVSLRAAAGRILGADVICRDTIPPFDASAMDGYAVRASEIESASAEAPVVREVVATIAAGDPAEHRLEPGQAARIMTGAPIPGGADVVVPHELTRFTPTEVVFSGPLPAGKNIRRRGGDMSPGLVVLQAGARLGGAQVAVCATVGETRLEVYRRPRVAILSPGNELVEPSEEPGPGQIRNSNAYGLAALVMEAGGVPDIRGTIEDTAGSLREEIHRVAESGADLIISTGGVSAGDFDHVHQVIVEDGRPGRAYKTDMRPGKPQAFGVLHGIPFLGLPGNPAAAIVSFVHFVRPVIRKLTGQVPFVPTPFWVRFPQDHPYKKGRTFMLRARVEPSTGPRPGTYEFIGAGDQDSGFLASLARANAIIELPADRSLAPAGECFPAWWIHEPG